MRVLEYLKILPSRATKLLKDIEVANAESRDYINKTVV